jgi:hypothetical protein
MQLSAFPLNVLQQFDAIICSKHSAGGWIDNHPTGTVTWTAPGGQTYTTHPGSRLVFPALCKPTAPVSAPAVVAVEPNRGLMMLRRKATRAQYRTKRIEAERRLNDEYVAERNELPPF